MFGLNEAGKTTIGKLITGDLNPDSGTVNVRGRLLVGHPVQLYCACAVLVSTLFMAMIELREGMQREGWLSEWLTSRGVIASVLVLLVVLILAYRHSKARRAAAITMKAILVTSEDAPGASFKNQQITILDYITELMPGKPDLERKKHTAEVLLCAMGFQMYDQTSGEPIGNVKQYLADGVTLEQCSGGQKQICYVMRMLSSRPQILICDEVLASLDQYVKARLLIFLQHLLKTRQLDAILFITCDLNPFPFIAHRLVHVHQGVVVEDGPVKQIMTKPEKKPTREYVNCHAMVTPSGKDLQALADNMQELRPKVLDKVSELSF